jgi:plasmid stability protein
MATQSLTVHLPDRLYSRLEARASESNRTVEAELIEILSTAIPAEFEMTPELGKELALLDQLDDASLWQTAREMLPAETCARLEQMHLKQRREGLSETETHALADLVRQYERTMLVRARAAVLLKHRGRDVSKLVSSFDGVSPS